MSIGLGLQRHPHVVLRKKQAKDGHWHFRYFLDTPTPARWSLSGYKVGGDWKFETNIALTRLMLGGEAKMATNELEISYRIYRQAIAWQSQAYHMIVHTTPLIRGNNSVKKISISVVGIRCAGALLRISSERRKTYLVHFTRQTKYKKETSTVTIYENIWEYMRWWKYQSMSASYHECWGLYECIILRQGISHKDQAREVAAKELKAALALRRLKFKRIHIVW